MATTQYIGSRYVPVFAEPSEWNSTRTYEPLTIVLHEGSSYTSKQYVPVGIELDNADYWAATGNYNAQIEQYRGEVKAEAARAKAAESVNADAIATEAARAKAAENVNADAIATEAARAKAAENVNADAIATEAARAKAAEKANADAIATITPISYGFSQDFTMQFDLSFESADVDNATLTIYRAAASSAEFAEYKIVGEKTAADVFTVKVASSGDDQYIGTLILDVERLDNIVYINITVKQKASYKAVLSHF